MTYEEIYRKIRKKWDGTLAMVPTEPVDFHDPKYRKPDPVGRPTLYTGLGCPKVKELLRCIGNDYTIEEACSRAGIYKQTFYNWIKKHMEFAVAVERAKSELHLYAKDNIARDIRDNKDTKLSVWLMETRQRDRYSKRTETLQSFVEPLTDEEEAEIEEALKNADVL